MADAAPFPPGRPSGGPADLTGRKLGRYEVLLMLASGGMANVYVARAQGVAGFERLVAIKVLHPHIAHDEEFISMFLDEARLAARLRNPNAVGTLDISDTVGDGYYLVMEYVEGDHFGNLMRAAARGGERLPTPIVARIVMDGLTGLMAAHTLTDATGQPLDLVHRDISPHNLLVGTDGIARITDFGIAKAQVRLSSTRDGQFKGKLSYMAPDQAASGDADQRSDLFSMGIVLWEALTGRRLFRGENNADVLNKILNPEVPPPSAFAPELAPFDAVTARALAKDPPDRFQNADEFLEAVENAATGAGGVATPRSVAREVAKWLGEKVKHEQESLRLAIEAAGRSELLPGVLPRPMESGSHPTSPSQVRAIGADATVGAKPSKLSSPPESIPPPRRRAAPIVIAVVASGLLGGVAGAWVLFGSGLGGSGEQGTPDTTETIAPAGGPTETTTAEAEPVAPSIEEPPPSDEDEATGVDDDADGAGSSTTVQVSRPGGRRRRRGGGSESSANPASATEQAPTAPATSPHPTTPSQGSGSQRDDDLMLNPYR
ncbi:MAG: serine/threonine protein kinase [Sandaracinaceae bacterium]